MVEESSHDHHHLSSLVGRRHHKHYQSSQELAHPSNKWSRVRLLLLLLLALYGLVTDLKLCSAEMYDTEGPQFTQEPSGVNYFTSIQGLLLHCSARGSPSPRMYWINQKDGQPVELVPSVREIYPNGTLYFPPFQVSYYRPDIHMTVYVCLAVNSVGTIRSRDIHVRAVINQQFDVRVESAYTSEGNDGLLTCVVPDPVKDFVSVTSWVKDSTLNIFPPHSGGGGRYFMAPSGELLIEDVSRNESTSTFRCRTVNRLTDETQLSENSARLQLKSVAPASKSPPRILSRTNRVRLKEGDVGVIFCLSEGHPPPNQAWMKVLSYGGLEPLRPSERVRVRKSAIIFENVITSDSGTYMCISNNTWGSDRHKIDVLVTKPLEVQVVPSVLTVDIGKSAELTCWTNRAFDLSSPSPSPPSHHQPPAVTITWRKDGTEVRPSLRMSFSTSGDKLRIVTVQREDKGIYQCFVKSEADMAQAAAELRLGDSPPQLIYRFIEQTLRPGTAVSMKCSATGNPTPQITWLLDGFPLPHTERLLIGQYVTMNGDVVSHVNITSTRVEDGGQYTCLAKSTNKQGTNMGTTLHSARLNIYGPPFVRNMPNSMTAVAGKTFHIKCPVAGYPISSISWEKDEQLLPSTIRQTVSPNGTLTIRDVDRAVDSGWYSCTANSKNGNSNRRGVHINVVVPPKLVPFSFPEVTREGERIFVTCVVSDGDGPIRLQWLKDSIPIHGPKNSSRSHTDASMSTHRIGDFDALALQIPHVTWNDTGNYSCVAYNSAGHASLTLLLVVHVPPRIAPYTFPSPVSEGSRVQVVCSVEQGDVEETNLTVVWLKDMQPIRVGTSLSHHMSSSPSSSSSSSSQKGGISNAKVMQVDAYSAILIIDRVDSNDSGRYTCKIGNSVEEVTRSDDLVIRIPPKWIDEPKDSEVVEGKSLMIFCDSKGFPAPKISWKRAMSDRPENFRDIPIIPTKISAGYEHSIHQEQILLDGMMSTSGSNAGPPGHHPSSISSPATNLLVDPVSYSNGTLFIYSARKSHHGYYLCESNNGIGSGLSKVVRLVVNVPIRIKEPQQNVSSPVGANAVLQCEISGDPPILAAGWKKGQEEIKADLQNSRYRIRVLNNSGSGTAGTTMSELTVTNVGREDTARYLCFASNRHGVSEREIWLFIREPPDTPRNLHVIAKGSRFVRLGWILTQIGNSPLKQFIIQYKQLNVAADFEELRVSGSVFSETIRNLRPATSYVFTVTAENQVGQSEASEGFELKTDGEAPEGKARNVRVAPVSSSDVQITWEHPPAETWHGNLLGYYVGYRRYREGEQYQFSTIERKEQALQEFLISGLVPFTSYEIIVQAYNGIGTGPMSEAMLVTTLEDVPNGFPEGIQCTPLTSDNLQLSWNPVVGESARGLIKGYRVILELVETHLTESLEAQDDSPLVKTTGTTNLICTGLAKYTNYSVQVQAFTGIGSGPASPPIYCQTEEDVPNSPAAIKAVVSSSSSIILSWLPPTEPNGIILKYNLYISSLQDTARRDRDNVGVKKRSVPADTHKFQFEGLRLDEKYEFRVSASTRVGEGKFILTQKTQAKNVVNSIISLGQDLKIVWKTDVRLACETVGTAITHQWSKFNELVRENERISMNRDGSLLIREGKREDGGNYTCIINQNGGTGGNSIVYKLTVQVPPSAPLMTAAGTSYSTVNLQWKLSDTGGASIKGYVLHVKASDEWIERRLSRHLSSYELQGLDCGTYYQMYLTAYNRAGMSMASDLANVSTLGSAPSLKLNSPEYMLVQSNKSVTRLLLKDVWTGNGCRIKGFRVLYKPVESSRWQAVGGGGGELDGESQSVDLVGLKANTNFHIRVVATNSAGKTQTDLTINTPSHNNPGSDDMNGDDAGTSQDAINQPKSTPFYLDVKLMGPVFLSVILLVVVSISACICYKRKSPADGQSNENLSGTPSSSLYFKHSHQHQLHQQQHGHPPQLPLRPSQQMYMTVKKSTPMKGVDMNDMDTIPQYADDIYPYATFEVNEPQRDSRASLGGGHTVIVPTLDKKHRSRRTSSGSGPTQDLHAAHHQMSHPLPSHHLRHPHRGSVQDESDEYDSYGSDSDYPEEMLQQQEQQQQHQSNKTRLTSSSNVGKSTAAGVRQQHQKFQDYDSHARCGNRYEFIQPSHNQNNPNGNQVKYQFHHERNASNEEEMIHVGMITSEPYTFNDSYPTAVVQDKRGTNKRKSGRRKFHVNNLEPYSELPATKFTLDPPEGFSDKILKPPSADDSTENPGGASKGQHKSQKVKALNEYAIAV